ncbi:MAG: TIM barrel protein [Methanocellales archaeon]
MKIGVKVARNDYKQMLELNPEALEFSLEERDLKGEWIDDLDLNFFFFDLIVHVPIFFENGILIDIASENPKLRKQSLILVLKTFEIARALYETGYFKGAPIIILHPGGITRQVIDFPNFLKKCLLESMGEILSKIDSTFFICTLENMPQFYWYRGEQYNANLFKAREEIIEVLRQLQIYLCLDLCHAKLYCNYINADFYDYIASLAPYTKHIHASDAVGVSGEGLQIGEGEIDFKRTLSLFKHRELAIVPEIKNKDRKMSFKIAVERLRAIKAIT